MLVFLLLTSLVVKLNHGVEHVFASLNVGGGDVHVDGVTLLVEHFHSHVLHKLFGAQQVTSDIGVDGYFFSRQIVLGGLNSEESVRCLYVGGESLVGQLGKHFKEAFLHLNVGFSVIIDMNLEAHSHTQRVKQLIGSLNLDGRLLVEVFFFKQVFALNIHAVEL